MPRISEARRAERRQQILHAARLCFQRDGLHLTTMDDIIRASGLSAGAVYGYFKSKDELILASVDGGMSDLQQVLRPIFLAEPLPPPEMLIHQVMLAIAQFSAQEGVDLKRVGLLGWAEAQRSDPVLACLRRHYGRILDDLTRAAEAWQATGVIDKSPGAREMAHALLAILLGNVAQAAILGDPAAWTASHGINRLLRGASPTRS